MQPPPDLATLAAVSRRLGADPAYVQGGGGNTSLKAYGGVWIKASGFFLSDVSDARGFVLVDGAMVNQGLAACEGEADYVALLRDAYRSGEGRPSIETGFHCLLPYPVVLHSHATAANILCCAEEGRGLAERLFHGCLWVDYHTPGLPLTRAMQALLTGTPDPAVLFLQNHGLIVAAADPDAAWDLHEHVCRTVLMHFELIGRRLLPDEAMQADATRLLFPDQAVYLLDAQLRASSAGRDTLRTYAALMTLMPEVGLRPRFLPAAESDVLINMESEKYRQKVATACA